ncbi:MAG: TM2 domain-containing protein [Verrucomicrobia bacterium]|jgi:TM2 domain-containing membrane protein YozV|nr:TM2 domain-containing protein [Verrucomicrobiota bacterium]MBT4276874.1 TM2 domain-containing protein [Verrucomicrobiota bacterium]MBT5063274.1 TM2 domain-containing protein [Verrucomicrobiota bacterium]MBT5478827.1 TM2 domain-containing protein [Verrucomicrobiota bacterium]MBT6239541.1 TM2 domain-containing protein [Verrucomicrobiota bacterium]
MQTHSILVGYLLWILGFTGSHRFYYGKPISGTIWLCTGGLFLIGWLIDLFLIPIMDSQAERRFATGRYNYTVSWILLTFLGTFGLHRLYLGKISGLIILGSSLVAVLFPPLILISMIFLIIDFWNLNSTVDELNRRQGA